MISADSIPPLLTSIANTQWVSSPSTRHAAVLVPLILSAGNAQLLFTQRSENLADHAGQISFPGGERESEKETPIETAMREAYEEIGLPAEAIRLLGSLDPIRTNTGFAVIPVVGGIDWPFPVRLESTEVDSIFPIPLSWFFGSGKIMWEDGCPTASSLHFPAHEGHKVWGATAMIVLDLVQRLFPKEKK
jgi:8-oxo-dGTP pyrophosphatase MutT (NUDIX family)